MLAYPAQRPREPLALDRLQQIVDHRIFERAHGIMIERRDEDHGWRIRPLGEHLDHFEAVAIAHFDVEQDGVGRERSDLG